MPVAFSSINSTDECFARSASGYLPLFVSPDDNLVPLSKCDVFAKQGVQPVASLTSDFDSRFEFFRKGLYFVSFTSEEIDLILDSHLLSNSIRFSSSRLYLSIEDDFSNGVSFLSMVTKLKERFPCLRIMVKGVLNPDTYVILSEIGVDFVRIGQGSSIGFHEPPYIGCRLDRLISECFAYRKAMRKVDQKTPAIVVDANLWGFNEIIMALALGADFVMLKSRIGILSDPLGDDLSDCIDKDDVSLLSRFRKPSRGLGKKIKDKVYSRTSWVNESLPDFVDRFEFALVRTLRLTGFRSVFDFIGEVEVSRSVTGIK